MSTRDTETLTDLVAEVAGKGPGRGAKLTFEQLSEKSVDPATGYKPSPNHLWRIAAGHDIKVNPPLLGAIAAGLEFALRVEYPIVRVRAAAARQFLGWEAESIPGADADQDEVLQVARAAGITPEDMPQVRAFFDELRTRRAGEK